MPQIGLFPLSNDELKAKGKEQAALELEYERLAEEKDTVSREFNERLKRLRGQILRLAKEIDTEKAERQATEEEAPWQELLEQAEDVAKGKRRKTRREGNGEVTEEPDGG